MPTYKIDISNPIDRIFTTPMLAYRRIRFGHAFRIIPLTQGRFAKVDPEDFERVSKFKWTFHDSKKPNGYYALRSVSQNGKATKIWMHRFIMQDVIASAAKQSLNSKLSTKNSKLNNLSDKLLIDHINHDTLDNRKANLRLATPQQNVWNSRSGVNSGASCYKGVTWDNTRKR